MKFIERNPNRCTPSAFIGNFNDEKVKTKAKYI